MKLLRSMALIATMVAPFSLGAQTAPVAENVSDSRAQTLAIITAAPVLEFSNSQQGDIVSYFSRNTWVQASTAGEPISGDIPIAVKRDGRVCIDGNERCFRVEAVSDGWYIVSTRDGLRADEKHMRYIRQN